MYKQDIILILIASFFYFSSPMLVTPLITGFTGELGASASLMGIVGGLMNLCSLLCRPFVGNLADKISKYKLSYIGGICMLAACLGYIFALRPALVVFARIVNGIGFACCSVCMSTWMSNMLPKEKIGSGMGVYGTMNALGTVSYTHLHIFCFRTFRVQSYLQCTREYMNSFTFRVQRYLSSTLMHFAKILHNPFRSHKCPLCW